MLIRINREEEKLISNHDNDWKVLQFHWEKKTQSIRSIQ